MARLHFQAAGWFAVGSRLRNCKEKSTDRTRPEAGAGCSDDMIEGLYELAGKVKPKQYRFPFMTSEENLLMSIL